MSVFETVRTVLAVRSYTGQQISNESLLRILESGRLTGSAKNKQPWHFLVIEGEQTLAQVATMAKTGPYILDAPMAIVVAIEKTSKWAVSDASRAIQSMMLSAWEEGIGSNWVGFGGMTEIAALLGIPDTHDVFAVVPFGYPVDPIGKGVKNRKPISEVVSHGHFGTRFEPS